MPPRFVPDLGRRAIYSEHCIGLVADDHGRANFGPNFEKKSAMRGARETGVVPSGRPPGGLPMRPGSRGRTFLCADIFEVKFQNLPTQPTFVPKGYNYKYNFNSPLLKSWTLAPDPPDFRVARRIVTPWLSQGQ